MDPTLSFGLAGVADWSAELPFLDLMKMSRPMWATNTGFADMGHDGLVASGVLDASGWPTAIPDGMTKLSTIWAFANGTPGAGGPFVVTWEGEGTILLPDATVISSGDHRIVFTNPDNGTFGLNITATDPNDNGDYIRNISIVPEKYEALADLGEIFNPDFLALIGDGRELRFMDWMETNGSVQSEWGDRPQVDDVTWASYGNLTMNGVPVEVMVQLANQTGTDPWFNIPHMATDEYIREFATYVRDHLNPDLVAHVEYSNETWNWAFPQTQWFDAQAKTVWGSTDSAAYLEYFVKQATETALIWDEVFGASADGRVDNVLAVQTAPGTPWNFEHHLLNAPIWQAEEPGNYVSPASAFDSIAVTTYFGGSTVADATLRAELLNYLASHTAEQTYDWLAGKLIDPTYSSSIPQIAATWAAIKTAADAYGLDLVAYEGGQHVHQSFAVSGLTTEQIDALAGFMTGFTYSQQMANLYATLWDAWTQVSDGPFMQFGDVATASRYGSFAMLRNLADINPRASFLLNQNAEQSSWFGDGGGARYQQGVIKIAGDGGETITGTDKDDFLVGGDGNDTFIPGNGNDAINGGDGNDRLRLAGSPDDYVVVADHDGYRLTTEGISIFIVNVELVQFDNAAEFSPLALTTWVPEFDTVFSSTSADLNNYPANANLTLLGNASVDACGNALCNILIGNSGDNILDGRSGADTLKGGLGNDTYLLADGNDTVIDNGGTDTITSTISRSLVDYASIENLRLLGSGNIDLRPGAGNRAAQLVIFG